MYKISNFFLDKYYFVKNFISGIKLNKEDIILIKNNKINFNLSFIKIDNNSIFFCFNKKKRFLLLKKKEIYFISNILKNKKYNCIPVIFLKIKSFYKIKISLVKKRE
ncbi:MAG: hypothetical protein ACAF48_00435 [Candidatus Carsonella ruddii]